MLALLAVITCADKPGPEDSGAGDPSAPGDSEPTGEDSGGWDLSDSGEPPDDGVPCGPDPAAPRATFSRDGHGEILDLSAELAAGTASAPVRHTVSEPGILTLCAGTWYVNITAAADVAIVGPDGSSATTVHGAGMDTVLRIDAEGIDVSVEGISLRGGAATDRVTFNDTTFLAGGGVFCERAASLTLEEVGIHANEAEIGGGLFAAGGCQLSTSGVQVTNNIASMFGGGVLLHEGRGLALQGLEVSTNASGTGGGVLLWGVVETELRGALIEANSANFGGGLAVIESAASLIDFDAARNISFVGGGVSVHLSDLAIEGASISENTAEEYGGGVYVEGESTLGLTHSTLVGNVASDGAGMLLVGSVATLEGVTLERNVADQDGGGVALLAYSQLSVSDARFVGNTAGEEGGGVHLDHASDASWIEVVFAENAAALGGAILLESDSTATAERCDFVDNSPDDLYHEEAGSYTWGSGASFTCDAAKCE